MKITVTDARTLAVALVTGANDAEKAGNAEFDLLGPLQALDNAARDDLQSAIEEARRQSA